MQLYQPKFRLIAHLIALTLVFQSSAKLSLQPQLLAPQDPDVDNLFKVTFSFLEPLRSCRQKFHQPRLGKNQLKMSNHLAQSITRFYFSTYTPMWLDPDPTRYLFSPFGGKHAKENCAVHLLFPDTPGTMLGPRIDFMRFMVHDWGVMEAFNKHDDVVIAFVNLMPWQMAQYQFPKHYCDYPLNTIVAEVVSMHGRSDIVPFHLSRACPAEAMLCIKPLPFLSRTLSPQLLPYVQLLRELRELRRNMHGSTIAYHSNQLKQMSWPEIQFFANAPLKYAYLDLLVANAKQLMLQLPTKTFNMSVESLAYAPDLDEACMDGSVLHFRNAPPYHFRLARPYVLSNFHSIRAIYHMRTESVSPYILTSLRGPIEQPLLIGMLFLFSLVACALLIIINVGLQSATRVVFATITAVWGATVELPPRALVNYIFWVAVTWYIANAYTSVLQSKTVVPEVKVGQMSLMELIKANYSMLAQREIMADMESVVRYTHMNYSFLQCEHCSSGDILEKEGILLSSAEPVDDMNEGEMAEDVALLFSTIPAMQSGMELIHGVHKKSALVSSDGLFSTLGWISYYNLPNSDLVSVNHLNIESNGLFRHWERVMQGLLSVTVFKRRTARSGWKLLREWMSPPPKVPPFISPGMDDTVLAESFCVGQYGMTLAVGAFVMEVIVAACRRVCGWLKSLVLLILLIIWM